MAKAIARPMASLREACTWPSAGIEEINNTIVPAQAGSFESGEHIAEQTYSFLAGDRFQDLIRERGSGEHCWSPKKFNAQ